MAKKNHTTKSGDTFEWEETDEVRKAIEQLHNDIRRRKLKEQDDKLNYDTGGK